MAGVVAERLRDVPRDHEPRHRIEVRRFMDALADLGVGEVAHRGMRVEAAKPHGVGVDDDPIDDRHHQPGHVAAVRRHHEFRRQALVEGHRVERVGEVVPALDAARNVERLAPRRNGELVLHFLQTERRANRDQLDDVHVPLLGQHFEGHDRPLAVCHQRDRRVPARQRVDQSLADGRPLLLVEEVGRRVGQERLQERAGDRLADEAGQRQHLGAHAAARRQRRLLDPVGPAQLLDVFAGVLVAGRDAGLGEHGVRVEGFVGGAQAAASGAPPAAGGRDRTSRPSGWPARDRGRTPPDPIRA